MTYLLQIIPQIPAEFETDWARVIFALLLITAFIFKLYYDWKRDKSAQMTMREMNHYLKVMAAHYTEEVSTRQMEKLIDVSVEQLKLRVAVDVAKIMIHNNVRGNPDINSKIKSLIKNAFDYFTLNLSMFKYNGISLANQIPENKYCEHITEYCLDIIKHSRITHNDGMQDLERLSSYMLNKFTKFKTMILQPIYDTKIKVDGTNKI